MDTALADPPRPGTRWRWTSLAAPQRFMAFSAACLPWLWAVTVLAGAAGLYVGFFVAPTDHQQGEAYRVIFIHVPAAWMSMLIYLVMAFWAVWGWASKARLASMYARALAPTGAMFTFVALWTGAFWGKPTWGTWWVWDGRLTSFLILLFLYFGYIALAGAAQKDATAGGGASRVTAIFGLVGAINIPIINRSVVWWNSLHQPASITMGKSSIDAAFLWPLLIAALGFSCIFGGVVLARMRTLLAEIQAEARLRRKAMA